MSSAPHPMLAMDQGIRSLTRDTCSLCGLCHATIEGLCFLCVVGAERVWENAGMGIDWTWVPKFQGKAVWPEEELEDLVCDVACAIHRDWECAI
jgi:hypothetical protein